MREIHKYTPKSVKKTVYLNVFLGALIISQGFYSKTAIQQLSKTKKFRPLKDNLLEDFPENYERVTFHPDYSYANFVGTYKPVPEGKDITYKYVPGPFMRILQKAIEKPSEPFLLVIEEINRANVAAVFGDVFQLLDRTEDYESEYPIDTSEDMKTYLNKDKIILPSSLFIWATMNSADQGVFPMDTAFKRRWDFKYFSINNNEKLIENTKTIINGEEVNWNKLRKQINDELLSCKSMKINLWDLSLHLMNSWAKKYQLILSKIYSKIKLSCICLKMLLAQEEMIFSAVPGQRIM